MAFYEHQVRHGADVGELLTPGASGPPGWVGGVLHHNSKGALPAVSADDRHQDARQAAADAGRRADRPRCRTEDRPKPSKAASHQVELMMIGSCSRNLTKTSLTYRPLWENDWNDRSIL